MSAFQTVLGVEQQSRNLSVDDIDRLVAWASQVGEIESNNIPDRKQSDGGPGRGKYQYELDDGVGAGANLTARQRLENWEKSRGVELPIPPEDRAILSSDNPDFSLLSEDTQDALFIVDKALAPDVPVSDIAQGNVDPMDAWIKYHWRGSDEEVAAKQQMWNERFGRSKKKPDASAEDQSEIDRLLTEAVAIENGGELPAKYQAPKKEVKSSGDSLDKLLTDVVEIQNSQWDGFSDTLTNASTLGLSDEIAGLLAELQGGDYENAAWEIRDRIDKFRKRNPALSVLAEVAGSAPTGVGLIRAMGKVGVKSAAKVGATEGATYGFAVGDRPDERLVGATVGGIAGGSIGRAIDWATVPLPAGGAKTQMDFMADAELEAVERQIRYTPVEPVTVNGRRQFAQRVDDESYTGVEPEYQNARAQMFDGPGIREATNVGELMDAAVLKAKTFYDAQLTGLTNRLYRRVSPQVAGRYQRSDEAALREMGKVMPTVIEPMEQVIKAVDQNPELKAAVLDYGANQLPLGQMLETVRVYAGDQGVEAVRNYLRWTRQQNRLNNQRVINNRFFEEGSFNQLPPNYLHTQFTDAAKARKLAEKGDDVADDVDDMMDLPLDVGAFKRRTRERGKYNPGDYKNPFLTDMQRNFHNLRLVKLAEKFEMPKPPPNTTANEFMELFEQTLATRGIDPRAAKQAKEWITENMRGQNLSPNAWIQGLQSIGYAGSLAGPKSAFLNIHDIPQAGAYHGFEAMKGAFVRTGIDLKDFGINNQTVGEFTNKINAFVNQTPKAIEREFADMTRKGTDLLMKGSLFAAMDQVGKRGVMNIVLKRAHMDAQSGKLGERWGFYFNNRELATIQKGLMRHGMNWKAYRPAEKKLIEELVSAGLGQQQLISGAGRPSGWARNPNLRPLWALRGFAMQQQALAIRNTYGALKAGKPDEAADFLKRYVLFAAGGFGVLNEARQTIWGDGEPSIAGFIRSVADQITSVVSINTIGLNDYQWGRIQEGGIVGTFLESLIPIAVDIPYELGKDTVVGLSDPEESPTKVVEELPFYSQNRNMINNLQELTESR